MARKQTTPAKGSPEISQEKLQALEIAPELLPQGMAVVRQQSDVKGAEETPTAHPMPAGPAEFEECDRMLASAESLDEKKVFFHKQLARQKLLGEIEATRAFVWIMENLILPRASIVGRYLHDEGINENNEHRQVDAQMVYGALSKLALHHLSEAAARHVKRALAPTDHKQSKDAASYFLKDLKRRIKLLNKLRFLQEEGDRFWLSEMGARVFDRWPWWSFKNDEDEPNTESETPKPS